LALDCSTLVLDLDGTISDPSLGISRCMNHALLSCGLETVAPELVERQIGPPLDDIFRTLAPGITDAQLAALISAYRERYSELGYAENELYPDLVETLVALRERDIRLGVCTSKRKDFAERIIDLFQLSEFFAFVDGGDVGVSKANQLAGLLQSGSIDEQAVMVGDRAVDIVAASSNQLRAIGVLWGFGDREELEGASPHHIVSSPAELRAFII
jgi:phosphoglycolate phosphatase